MKSKHKKEPKGAPVFTARNYPPASFSMPTDGRKGKRLCQDRRNLYVQITSYGMRPHPSVETLAEAMDWSEKTTYRRLAELRELGCLPNATDARGRKYTGRHGTRVRSVDTSVLPGPGSSRWLAVKDCPTSDGTPLLVQFVNREGLPASGNSLTEGLSDSIEELSDSVEGPSDSIEGLSPCVTDERTNLERTNLGRTNPNPKELDGRTVSLSGRLTSEDRACLKPILRKVREVWEGYWTEYLPSKWPNAHANQKQAWAAQGKKFQSFADADYRDLNTMLVSETEEQLIKRWAKFIREKDDSTNGWDDAEYPFRIFVRQP